MALLDKLIKAILTPFFKLIHKDMTDEQWTPVLQFIKFCIVGATNTVISYVLNILVVFALSGTKLSGSATISGVSFSPDVLIANVVAFILSVLWSYYWNNRFVFTLKDGQKRNWFKALLKTYLSYAVTGLLLACIMSWLWVDVLNVSKLIAPLLNLVISVPVNFILNKLWAFKSSDEKNEETAE